jgi:hypothetical protein
MPFEDLPDGQTHSYDDGCEPAHEKPATMRKVYKYGTGENIPEGAVYLSTQVETETEIASTGETRTYNMFVWHYFLVEVKE